MFSKNDYIIYGSTGVCEVKDICTMKDGPSGKLFYKLMPLFEKCVILVPTDTKIFMRPIITKEEALNLISKLPLMQISLPETQNSRQLKEYYKSTFTFHTCEELSLMIKTIYARINSQTSAGKKPCQTDLKYIKKAEELLYGELSVALGIPYDSVPGFIEKTISDTESENMCQCG